MTNKALCGVHGRERGNLVNESSDAKGAEM